ncbi:hypothetical protein KSD_71070 [Ktedonobacter sp. SOSP1-85]|uniref:hypothetical protein n=1 Tax=Ktedonobacter sp. SOSP1-85 TaxID=2778367 RepID=UPI0019167ED9|nr:hypothetical protein [Ktedonobacter sp. SOSP1-85]GHO79336.1 hypothetical protein KSD_71070 [Ktedonobacter sp. SOSP1-85]
MSVFDFDGKPIALKDITTVSYPARWEKLWVADDLEDWLWPTMSAIHGPFYGGQTCIAALQLRDQPEKGHSFRRGKLLYAKEQLPKVQGGLFCIDPRGQILVRQECLLGESLRMCLSNRPVKPLALAIGI